MDYGVLYTIVSHWREEYVGHREYLHILLRRMAWPVHTSPGHADGPDLYLIHHCDWPKGHQASPSLSSLGKTPKWAYYLLSILCIYYDKWDLQGRLYWKWISSTHIDTKKQVNDWSNSVVVGLIHLGGESKLLLS